MDAAMEEWIHDAEITDVVRIDRKDIQRFAIAIRCTDPIHLDPEAARKQGHRDIVAPPLFYVTLRTGVFNLVAQSELHPEGTPLRDAPPITFTQAMAGETQADLFLPFIAGDSVNCARRVEDVYEKDGRSGKLTFVRFEYRYADPDDEPYVIERFTRIFR